MEAIRTKRQWALWCEANADRIFTVEVKTMDFENVNRINDNLCRATHEAVDEAQVRLCLNFPKGYREYVTTLGRGTFCDGIRIGMPDIIVREAEKCREVWRRHYWGDDEDVLSKQQVFESTCLGWTDNGDYLIYRQLDPRGLFALSGGMDRMYYLGSDLYEALDWCCESGELVTPTKFRYFDSGTNGKTLELYNSAESVSHNEIRQKVLALGIHDHILRDKPGVLVVVIKRIHGIMQCTGGRVWLHFDQTKNPAILEEIVRQLNLWGFAKR